MELLIALGIVISLIIVAGVVVTALTGNPFLGFLASLLMIWGTWSYWGPIHGFAARIWGGVPPIGTPVVPTAEISLNPTTIDRGQSATLTWRTDNADNVTLNGGNVNHSGTRSVNADQTTTYRLIARGPGGTREATATLNVRPASPGPAPTTNPGPVVPPPTATITPTVTAPPAQGTPSPGWRTPYTAHTSQPDPIRAQKMRIVNNPTDGTSNVYQGAQLDLSKLENLGQNEIYLAHGDVVGNGGCSIKVWYKGKPVQGQLSAATWQMLRIRSDSMPALDDAAAVEQLIAERLSTPCPIVNKY